jgi:spore germination cell wall hydrolase CwlJ-like protein
MKIIITESQYRLLVKESTNPCPEGVSENGLITLDQIKNGSTISKGYCNANENSAIVKIQKMLQDKGLLDTSSYNGYYGEKTQEAIKSLWLPSEVKGTIIGNKTLEKLEGSEVSTDTNKKETTTISSEEVSKNEALKLFNGLTENEKILVCTLIGEAGGESNALKSMTAVANVLKNRADNNYLSKGTSMRSQALANKQFSMWNDYNANNEKLIDVYRKYNTHDQMQTAINIVKSIESLDDITGGAQYYYANYVLPYWAKNTDTTKWVQTTTIGNHIFGNVVKKKKQ